MIEAARNGSPESIEQLRARLAEAEETLRAIRNGEVDALVVQGVDAVQIYSLRGAEEPYRILVERMGEGALTVTPEGNIVYANRHFADLLGMPLEAVLGRSLSSFAPATARGVLEGALARASLGGREELMLLRADGSSFPALLSCSVMLLEGTTALAVIVTDLTEQKRRDELAASARFARDILDQAVEAMVVCDAAGQITYASRSAVALAGRNPIALTLRAAFMASEADSGLIAESQVQAALAGELVHQVDVELEVGTHRRYCLLSAGPLRDAAGAVHGCVVTLTDITERRRAEQLQHLLLQELSHRVKNTLAVIQAIAGQTAVGSRSADEFVTIFVGRLRALSAVHDLLSATGWKGASLVQLARAVLAPHVSAGDPRVSIEIEDHLLRPSVAQTLALALHELATNAGKYGALSVPEGSIAVATMVGAGKSGPELSLHWHEIGGPPVIRPATQGFGTRLLSRMVVYQHRGSLNFSWLPDGLVCQLGLPLDEAVQG